MPAKRRIIDDALYAHFVTFSVYRLLDHDYVKRIVLGVLNLVLERTGSRCIGFVLMPNHVYALTWLPVVGKLSHFLHEWKRLSAG